MSAPQKHIMLSYDWFIGKDRVVELGGELRRLGYDVWRDEEGSTILEKMQGASDDKMGDAIDKAGVVVVCVSPGYKDSVNCKKEAKYAFEQEKKRKLVTVFVMMSVTYHTRSPVAPDGVYVCMYVCMYVYEPASAYCVV